MKIIGFIDVHEVLLHNCVKNDRTEYTFTIMNINFGPFYSDEQAINYAYSVIKRLLEEWKKYLEKIENDKRLVREYEEEKREFIFEELKKEYAKLLQQQEHEEDNTLKKSNHHRM